MHNLFAVFGNPILHSKSPLMFNTLLNDAGFYTRIRVNSAADLADAVKTLKLSGANVTAPFKEEIIPFMDELSEEVSLIGGGNTISSSNGRLKAFNTDWYGATQAVMSAGLSIRGLRVVLLGVGGAGKAAAYGLIKEGAELILVNRTVAKAEEMAAKLSCQFRPIDNLPELLQKAQLFVSAILPSSTLDNLTHLPQDIWLLDANYHGSSITKIAAAGGNPSVDPNKWLLYQAAKSYEHLFGTIPDIDVMGEALKLPVPTSIKAVGICNQNYRNEVNAELTIIPKAEAARYIVTVKPDLVIYTPDLGIKEVEDIYAYERDKAFGR